LFPYTALFRSGLEAFDTGPANGMVDRLVQSRMKKRMDEGGRLAAAGTVDQAVLDAYLAHPYFAASGPKSLDRFDFSLDPVADLSLGDAAATLTAFAAQAVALGVARCSEQPKEIVVCGGGPPFASAPAPLARPPRTRAGAATRSRPRPSPPWPRAVVWACRSASPARQVFRRR